MTSEKDKWRAVVNMAINDYFCIMVCCLWQNRHQVESPGHRWDANNIKIPLKGVDIKVWIDLM